MLSKKNKIQRADFPSSSKKGMVFHSTYTSLSLQKQTKEEPNKFSFVVSGKVSKKAVVRNKLKRRGYYVIKKFLPTIKIGYFVVFFLKKEIVGLSYSDFEKQILFLLNKAKLIK